LLKRGLKLEAFSQVQPRKVFDIAVSRLAIKIVRIAEYGGLFLFLSIILFPYNLKKIQKQ
jgi:hypothetical protein